LLGQVKTGYGSLMLVNSGYLTLYQVNLYMVRLGQVR